MSMYAGHESEADRTFGVRMAAYAQKLFGYGAGNGSGYEEILTGIFVPEEDAFNYALERCFEIVPEGVHEFKWTQEFREMLVEWFYSGNWIKED